MASVATLVDKWDAGFTEGVTWTATPLAGFSVDTSKVTAAAGGISVAHTTAIQYNGLQSVAGYDFTGSSASVQVNDYGNQALVSHQVQYGADVDANNRLYFIAAANNLSAWRAVAAAATQVGSQVALSLTAHRWLRLRESGGTTFWDTSFDGRVWTNQWSLANPLTMTALRPVVLCGAYNTEASGSQALFDNFNTSPAIGRPLNIRQAVRRASVY